MRAVPEVTSYQPGVPSWTDLMTKDPEGARAFYGELFGWEFDIGGEETGHYTMCRKNGMNAAGMGGEPAPEGMPTAWTTYMASDDIDAAAERISANGGNLLMEPMTVMQYGRMLIATDPPGAVFGLWQPLEHIGASIVNEPGSITWNELATSDMTAAQDFYNRILGYTYEPVDSGEGPPYQIVNVEGRGVGGMIQMTDAWPEGVPPHWMPYFAVEDADATAATAERLGGAVTHAAIDSPYGRLVELRDPQGGVFTAMHNAD
jgi:predicted enzyme related to lactoylglutathione lyase